MKNKELIDSLRKIANDPEFESRTGICMFISHNDGDLADFLEACQEWPKYSGYMIYPVTTASVPEQGTGEVSRMTYEEELCDLYETAQKRGRLWDPTTEYGRNRRELALWYADYLENQDEE